MQCNAMYRGDDDDDVRANSNGRPLKMQFLSRTCMLYTRTFPAFDAFPDIKKKTSLWSPLGPVPEMERRRLWVVHVHG